MNDEGEEKVEGTSAGVGPEPAAAGPQVVRRPLMRSRTNRMFAGVAGGLGEYFGVDPILVRLAFAVLTLLGGAGVALYLAAWLLIPLEGEAHSVGEEAMGKATAYFDREFGAGKDRSWIWITLLVIGGLVVISNLGSMGFYDGAWFWAILLIAGGVWLYRQDTYERNPGSVAPERPVDPTMTAATAGGRSATTTTITTPVYPARPARPVHPPKVRPVKAPPSRLRRYTFAIVLVVLGTLAMLDNAGSIDVTGAQYAAAALTTVGAGLIVGSVWGRSRSLIFWGLLLVPFVLVADQVDVPLDSGTGERRYAPTTVDQIAADHEMFAGNMAFDLSDLEWGPEPVVIDARLFVGQMQIEVPEGVDVKFRGHVDMGVVNVFGRERSGNDIDLNSTTEAGDGPELILNTDVFMGEIVVRHSDEQAKELS